METSFCSQLANGYKSKSQIARVLTEAWTEQHMYCPVCGWPAICKFPNNRAVADFYCPSCNNQFEQKSKNGAFGDRISDGAYHTFIQRISGNDNPNFLVMNYSLENMRWKNCTLSPNFSLCRKSLSKESRYQKTLKEQDGLDAIYCWAKYLFRGESRLWKMAFFWTNPSFCIE